MKTTHVLKQANTCGLVLVSLLYVSPTLAQYVPVLKTAPEFPIEPTGSHISALRSRYNAFALAFGDSDGDAADLTKTPPDWTEFISHATSVYAAEHEHPERSAFAELKGITKFGKLSVTTHAWVENGFGVGSAVMDMQFMDVMQVDSEGILHLNWKVSGTADQVTLSRNSNAGSSLTAELYVWPYGVLPKPGLVFPFTNYAKTVITGVEDSHLLPTSYVYPAGSRWWVLGQLSIQSRANADSGIRLRPPYRVETTAEFGNTVELFIVPDPSTPSASFHFASGHDYRVTAVPEAATWLMMIVGLLMLSLRSAGLKRWV